MYYHINRYLFRNSVKYITHPVTENWQHERTAVHPCKLKRKLCEFRLSRASLKCIKVRV